MTISLPSTCLDLTLKLLLLVVPIQDHSNKLIPFNIFFSVPFKNCPNLVKGCSRRDKNFYIPLWSGLSVIYVS